MHVNKISWKINKVIKFWWTRTTEIYLHITTAQKIIDNKQLTRIIAELFQKKFIHFKILIFDFFRCHVPSPEPFAVSFDARLFLVVDRRVHVLLRVSPVLVCDVIVVVGNADADAQTDDHRRWYDDHQTG